VAKRRDRYAKLSLDYPDHPKIAVLSDAAFRAHVEMILYAARYQTDGIIQNQIAKRWVSDAVTELLNNDTSAPSLRQLEGGDYQLHGYGEMQQTRQEIEQKRQIYAENGRLGGRPKKTKLVSKAVTGSETKTKPEGEGEGEGEVEVEGARTRATRLSDSWTPTTEHRDRAAKSGIDLDREVVKFRAYVEDKGITSKSWNQRFTRWLMNAEDYAKRNGRPTQTANPASWLDTLPRMGRSG